MDVKFLLLEQHYGCH